MIPVVEAEDAGSLIAGAGQVQFGPMLLTGPGSAAGWRTLAGWRDLPEAALSDSPRPQAHGDYPGSVFGEGIVTTYTFLLRGSPADKLTDLLTIERWTQLDGVERWLAVDDGDGTWMRRARVVARSIPQDKHFRHGPLECSVQFRCADPRRYSVNEVSGNAGLSGGVGGLTYALTYPLNYGTAASGSLPVNNHGSTPAPFVATFQGPLTTPGLAGLDWQFAFDLTLATGETLVVDTASGTALLNGTADRLHLITNQSDPLDTCLLPVGSTTVALSAVAGTGLVQIAYRPTRM